MEYPGSVKAKPTASAQRARYSKMKRGDGKTLALIKKELNKQFEKKEYQDITTYAPLVTEYALTGAGDANFILTGITKGTDDYQRVGDRIKLSSIHMKGSISVQNAFTSGVLGMMYVTVLMLACKSAPQASSTTMPWTSLLRQNGAYNAWTGTGVNRCQEINTDDFELLARRDIKMSSLYATTATQAITSEPNSWYTEFSITKYFKGRYVQYQSGLNQPSVFNPFFAFAITNGNCTTNAVYAGIQCVVNGVVTSRFTDA